MKKLSLPFTETLLSMMDADLVYNQQDSCISLLHTKELPHDLQHVNFRASDKRLFLQFETRGLDFGMEFDEQFTRDLLKTTRITLIHIDPETKKAINGIEVPLKQID